MVLVAVLIELFIIICVFPICEGKKLINDFQDKLFLMWKVVK